MTLEVPVDSDDAHSLWSCRRKKQYPTYEVAEKIAAQINASNGVQQVRSYGCRHCGQFHVGAVPGMPRGVRALPRKSQRRVSSHGSSYGSMRRRHKRERYQNRDEDDD